MDVYLSYGAQDGDAAARLREELGDRIPALQLREAPSPGASAAEREALVAETSATICLVGPDTHRDDGVVQDLELTQAYNHHFLAVRLADGEFRLPGFFDGLRILFGYQPSEWDIEDIATMVEGWEQHDLLRP